MVHAVFLDLSKEIDSLSLETFVKKLETLSFSHLAIECIESFLTKRLQLVTLNELVADWIEPKQDGPKRTVLGPQLFNLYVNDLSKQINETTHIIQ